jgi:hypothetical protein
VALVRKMAIGSGELLLIGIAAHQDETDGSKSARRHKSTRGNSSASESASVSVAVTRAQGTKRPGDALAADDDDGVLEFAGGNFDLR